MYRKKNNDLAGSKGKFYTREEAMLGIRAYFFLELHAHLGVDGDVMTVCERAPSYFGISNAVSAKRDYGR